MNKPRKWTFYTALVAFSTYWLANLLLWYPWSYDPVWGMTIMFAGVTPIWFYAVYHCLKKYNGKKLMQGALYTAIIFTGIAVILDYIFYGIIRNAMAELYHPTTFYGYAFLLSLPFIEVLLLRKSINRSSPITWKHSAKFSIIGILSLLAIVLIVQYNIKLSEAQFRFITMVVVSLIVFILIIWGVLGTKAFVNKISQIVVLSAICVVLGMFLGKFGAGFGLPWWIYYPVPALLNLALPPVVLKMEKKQVIYYIILSVLSAPFIHYMFSWLLNWNDYMPFL